MRFGRSSNLGLTFSLSQLAVERFDFVNADGRPRPEAFVRLFSGESFGLYRIKNPNHLFFRAA
jgi:hypothetical protein